MSTDNRKEQIKNIALAQLPSLIKSIYPNGKMQGNQFVIGDIHGNVGDSLKIDIQGDKSGLWNDFASDHSGDIFDLLALHFKLDSKKQFCELLDKTESLLSINASNVSKPVVTGTWVYS